MAELSRLVSAENTSMNASSQKDIENKRKDSVVSAIRSQEDEALSLGAETEKERAIAKAALSVAELGASLDDTVYPTEIDISAAVALLDAPAQTDEARIEDEEGAPNSIDELDCADVPLRSIRTVTDHIPAIESARNIITSEMESMVLGGLASLVND